MKKKLLMLSVFALATTAMASATLKQEFSTENKLTKHYGVNKTLNGEKLKDSSQNYLFVSGYNPVYAIDSNGDYKKKDGMNIEEHPLDASYTPKAVTSLNIDTDLVKADLAFELDRNFSYTNATIQKLGETGKYRNVKNLTDGQTQNDMYGDAELTYKINDNLTAKGFLHFNERQAIKHDDPIVSAVKIGLDYNYAGVSGRGLLMAIGSRTSGTWHGLSLDAKTNVGKFELTGDALGLFRFKDGKIENEKSDAEDKKSIKFPAFYSELNLGAKYVDGALTSDNKFHYNSNISTNSHKTVKTKATDENTKKEFIFGLVEGTKFWDKDNDKYSPLDLKLTSENTYKFNDKVTLNGDVTLEHKINNLGINTVTNSKEAPEKNKGVIKNADYIIEVKPGVKYEDQMGALKLTATGDSKISYDYNRAVDTIEADKLTYKGYLDTHTFKAEPGAEAKVEYKINDELKATGHVGLGTDLEYIKENQYDTTTDNTKAEYNGDVETSIKGIKPSLGAGLEYMNGSLTASVKANVSNADIFTTISSHDKDGKPSEAEITVLENKLKAAKAVIKVYELENKGTNVALKADYKVNDQISAGAEASVNMHFINMGMDIYNKDDKNIIKNSTTIFQLTDNGLKGDKNAKSFFSVYGTYKPMSSLTTTATAKVELGTTMTEVTNYDTSKEGSPVLNVIKSSSIDLLKPSFELKADYTILKGLKLGAITSIGANFGTGEYKFIEGSKDEVEFVPGAYNHIYDKYRNEMYKNMKVSDLSTDDKKAYEKAVKDGDEIKFKDLTYKLGLTLSYEW